MAHFYDCKDAKSPILNPEITTPSQAVKAGKKIYPSVTTVISSTIRDPFLDVIHKPRSLVKFARMEEHDDKDWRDLERLCYGERLCPETEEMIPSSEFGTRVHNCAEKLLNAYRYSDDYEEDEHYDPFAAPFLDWVKDNEHKVIATEYMLADGRLKLCGSVDAILKDQNDSQLFLADYKCRKSKQFYDKDLWQLAIESEMLRRRGLDYQPRCISVCIDVTTKKHHHKVWDQDKVKEAIEIMKLITKLYWKIRMK